MKIETLRIQNFRSFRDETIPFNDYSCFVGPNGAGKSTVLSALNVFFQNPTSATPSVRVLEEEDFHDKNTEETIRITLTLADLSKSAKATLNDYIRQDKLIVTAEAIWDQQKLGAPVKQYGERLGMKIFAERYFDRATLFL